MSVRQVDFGRLDAETEEHLLEYFVDTGVVARIASGARQYVVGRKGSGKTALFRRLDEKALGHPVFRMEFADYSWEAHKQLAEAGVTAESAYVASWRFTFLMSIVSYWADKGAGGLKRRARKITEAIYGAESPPWYWLLFDKLRRIRRLDLPEIEGVGGLGGFELSENEEGPVLASSINLWSRRLLVLVQKSTRVLP